MNCANPRCRHEFMDGDERIEGTKGRFYCCQDCRRVHQDSLAYHAVRRQMEKRKLARGLERMLEL